MRGPTPHAARHPTPGLSCLCSEAGKELRNRGAPWLDLTPLPGLEKERLKGRPCPLLRQEPSSRLKPEELQAQDP